MLITTENILALAKEAKQRNPDDYTRRARDFFGAITGAVPVEDGNAIARAMGFEHLVIEEAKA